MSLMSSDQDVPPESIGCFRVVRQLGRGSASTVYLGERADSFSQRVAIKLLHETQSRTALDNEHRLLSSLDHAYIVRLLDQGVAENGLCYLVMEFVDGAPIDQYCDAKRLSAVERIQLLIKVLSALSYAQRHLVVHADIKPSNILVDAAGEPKLLDFGISRRSGSADERGKPYDRDGAQFTPAFASPEQLAGESVSAVSDIYSAGLVARQLLKAGGPSIAADDLSLILNKATRSEPELRYRSAQEFADDLARPSAYRGTQGQSQVSGRQMDEQASRCSDCSLDPSCGAWRECCRSRCANGAGCSPASTGDGAATRYRSADRHAGRRAIRLGAAAAAGQAGERDAAAGGHAIVGQRCRRNRG
jgi:serine/threonine protein kinase